MTAGDDMSEARRPKRGNGHDLDRHVRLALAVTGIAFLVLGAYGYVVSHTGLQTLDTTAGISILVLAWLHGK